MVWLGYRKQRLPTVGDAFLVPIARNTFTFCWVVRLYDKREVYGGRKLGSYTLHSLVIACAQWTGSTRPTQAELDAREVRPAYDLFAKTLTPIGPLALVSSSPPPKRWAKLGKVRSPDIDVALIAAGTSIAPDGTKSIAPSHAGFLGLQRYVKRAWALERDPARLLAAESASDAAVDAEMAADDIALAARLTVRKRAKLTTLATVDLLPEWDGLVDARHRKAVAKLLVECVANLRAIAKRARPTRAAKLAAIEATVDKINAWNDRISVIETPEREALCTAIDDIGHAAGLRGSDLGGPYRDW